MSEEEEEGERERRTLSSRRIHSLVLVAVDQWLRRSVSRTLRAFCAGDSLDIALTLNGRALTRGSNSTSIFAWSITACDGNLDTNAVTPRQCKNQTQARSLALYILQCEQWHSGFGRKIHFSLYFFSTNK